MRCAPKSRRHGRRSRRCWRVRDAAARRAGTIRRSPLPSAWRVLALGILLIAAAMLVRNNLSLGAGRSAPAPTKRPSCRPPWTRCATASPISPPRACSAPSMPISSRLLDLPARAGRCTTATLGRLPASWQPGVPCPPVFSSRRRRPKARVAGHPSYRLGRPRTGYLQGCRSRPAAS